jgi:hypothetical protein
MEFVVQVVVDPVAVVGGNWALAIAYCKYVQ